MKLALDELEKGVEPYTLNEIEVIITDDVLPYTEKHILDYRSDEYGEGFFLGSSEDNGCSC